jgi:hypothetical protein
VDDDNLSRVVKQIANYNKTRADCSCVTNKATRWRFGGPDNEVLQ